MEKEKKSIRSRYKIIGNMPVERNPLTGMLELTDVGKDSERKYDLTEEENEQVVENSEEVDSYESFKAYSSGVGDGYKEGYKSGFLDGERSVKLSNDEYYEGMDDGMEEGIKFAESKLGTMGGMVELIKKRIGENELLFKRLLKHLDKQFDGKIGLKEE